MNIATLFNAMPGALAQGLIWAIMAIGVYLTFRILDVADLTVDGTLGLGGAVCIMCMISGMNVWLSLLLAFGAGLLAGLVTGLFHTFMGIPAILAGILTQLSLYSVNLKIMGKANQAINVDKYDLLVSLRYIKGVPFYRNTILIVAVLMVVVIAILYWFFGTELGCSIRATGCNANMARAQGINTNFNIVLGLMLSNGLVAFSGALLSQYQGFADVQMGRGAIVIGLAAVVIGVQQDFSQLCAQAAQRWHRQRHLLHCYADLHLVQDRYRPAQNAQRHRGRHLPCGSILESKILHPRCGKERRQQQCLRSKTFTRLLTPVRSTRRLP